jgi:broad specificity phosphatase PhoE
VEVGRFTETHEYFHRQLDDTTAFGGLIGTVAALADSLPLEHWTELRRRLLEMADLVHESFAVGMSLLTTQRAIEPMGDYPTYDRYVAVVRRLLGQQVHPWVALAAIRAAAIACMQTGALKAALESGLSDFDPSRLPRLERPNHRLAALLAADYSSSVAREQARAELEHRGASWWYPSGGILLSPDSMDGAAAESHSQLQIRLLRSAEMIVGQAGGTFVPLVAHQADLRGLLSQARGIAPAGLARIGALVETPGAELLHGGPLDGQVVELSLAPRRGVVLPYGSASSGSGEGQSRHVFVALTTRRRLEAAFDLEGVELPADEVVACVRSTVFDGDRRDAVLLMPVEQPSDLHEQLPVFLSVVSSAAAADPQRSAEWMRAVDPNHLSLVMDTPATAALRRWCATGARFHTSTRLIEVHGDQVRVIAGRVAAPGSRSALVIIPSTEFGARWFEQACAEDDILSNSVVQDDELYERESAQLNIVLNHLLLEERFVGTGSWRR